MQTKEAIRSRLLSERQSLHPSNIHLWSHQACENLSRAALMRNAKAVGLYAPMRGEVATEEIFDLIEGYGARVGYPKIEGDVLRFYEVSSPSDLIPGPWGILEPLAREGYFLDLKTLDALVVPGVAFDESGHRIGFGKGYYDRILEVFSGVSIGLAYEFQIMKDVPHDPLDQPCHWVVTEKRIIERQEGKGG